MQEREETSAPSPQRDASAVVDERTQRPYVAALGCTLQAHDDNAKIVDFAYFDCRAVVHGLLTLSRGHYLMVYLTALFLVGFEVYQEHFFFF